MRGAYSEIYLDDAMRNMGEMVEYGEEACGLDQDLLLRMFVRSGYADRWEKGDPRVICGLSGTELCRRLLEATYADRGAEPAPLVRYDTGEAYWRGFALAYYQWRSGRNFSEILAFIGGKDLQRMYPAYHTASEEKTADELEALFDAGDVIRSNELILVCYIAVLRNDRSAVGFVMKRDRVVRIFPLDLVNDETGLCKLLNIEHMIPVKVSEDNDVNIFRRISDLFQSGLDIVNTRSLHGRTMMIFIRMLIPGHTCIHKDQLVSALDQICEIRKLVIFIGNTLLLNIFLY